MKNIKIILPLYVLLPRKTIADKKVIINLNQYRNWCFMVNNQVKQIFKESLRDQLEWLKIPWKIDLVYTYYKGRKWACDKANVLCIQDKFFCDALTEYKCIEDDNDDIVQTITFKDWGIDKNNPRVVVEIINK